ncbi:MAG: Unknown protein [uncultured Thiotrichaceae bacterium]|uniref:DNA polymerase III tau subunit domain-containing protein n=1 Tax=uncultured Thiotrichaceae bacterium TaxID=298394 RepID=A0A6S6TIT7_9GAMM|nr:MAG: Unknown protein [uncultured Thiotrichaceae bacterium]
MEAPVVEEAVPAVELEEEGSDDDNEWHKLLATLKLGGMAKQLAEHCLLRQLTDDKMFLLLEMSGVTLKTRLTEEALQEALSDHLGRPLTVEYEVVADIAETPAQRRVRQGEELQQQAEQSIEDDPFVQQLRRDYGGIVLPASVRPNKISE